MNNRIGLFFKSRSFKRGALSTALTAAVVAAVIILNAAVTALAVKYYWYIDMTKDSVFKISEEGMSLLEGIDSEINIIFCDDTDNLQSNLYQKSVYNTALELSSRFDNIHIKNLDIYKNPSSVAKYKTTSATSITNQSVIIESGGESRVFPLRSFFTFSDQSSSTPWAYNGEYRIISTILQLTASEHPKAYFTVGHGESLADAALWSLFSDAGYEVLTIDLTKDEIAGDARFVIINDPVYDFQGISADTEGKKSEIEKIDDFLDDFGCLMVFVDPDTGKLPVLDSFLKEWGIEFDGRTVKDYSSSLTSDGGAIVAQYATGKTTGASLISSITSLPLPPKAIVKYATPIKTVYTDNGSRIVSPVLMTTNEATVYDEEGVTVGQGKYNLMTLTRETRYVDNQAQYSYVLAAGTTSFATEEYIGQKAYSNSDILYAAMKQMGKERVPVDLDLKPFDNTELDITASEATSWTVALVTILPVLSILICAVILIRRKHA